MNIGNARLALLPLVALSSVLTVLRRLYGMEEDLGLTGNQYQIAVSILFVTYVVGQDR